MLKLNIPIKFYIGNTVYVIKKKHKEIPCSLCDGTGKVKYKDREFPCPECLGRKSVITDQYIYTLYEKSYKVISVRATVNTHKTMISYKVAGETGKQLDITGEYLFASEEEAQKRCDELNLNESYISLKDIIIKEPFINTYPMPGSIKNEIEYYKSKGIFKTNIVIDKNKVLQEGYVSYFACGILNIDKTLVKINDKETGKAEKDE